MQTARSGLINIILHDSFYKDLRTAIGCDGHVNLHGQNGAGKSSTLILVPIFYGLAPDSLILRAAGKDNFVDFYLPSTQSMAVFEYRRESGICCAVLYRHPTQNKHVYRFVEGTADSTIFAPENDSAFAGGESAHSILTNLSRQGINTSAIIYSAAKYEKILAGQIRQLDSSERKIAFDFSLPARGAPMQHIAALAGVMQSKSSILTALKSMFADIIGSEHRLGEKPQVQQQQNAAQLKNLRELQSKEHELHHGVNQAKALARSQSQLAAYKIAADERAYEAGKQKETLIAAIETANSQFQAVTETKNAQIQQLNAQKSEANGDLQGKQSTLKKIQKEAETFAGIEDKIRLYDSLEEKRAALARAAENCERLTGSARDAALDYENAKARIVQDSAAAREKISAERSRLHGSYDRAREVQESEYHALQERHSQAKDALREKHGSAKALLQEQLNELKQQYGRRLSQEDEALAGIDRELERASESVTSAEAAAKTAGKAQQDAKTQEAAAAAKHRQAETALLALKQEYQKLDEILNGSGTLLAYLRKDGRAWERVAKLINPELLQHKKLEPEWLDAADTFYGLALNTDVLDIPVEAQPNENIQNRKDRLVPVIQDAEQDLKAAEKALQTAQENSRQKTAAVLVAEQKVSAAAEKRQLLEGDRKDAVSRQHEALNARNAVNLDEQTAVNDRLAALDDAHKKELQELAERQKQDTALMQAAQKRLKEDLHSKETALDAREAEIKHTEAAELENQARIYRQQLSEQGLDAGVIDAAKHERDNLKKQVDTIQDSWSEISKYNYFKENHLSRRPQLEQDIRALQDNIAGFEQQITSIQNDFNARKAAHDKAQQEKRVQVEGLQRQENDLSSRLQRIRDKLQGVQLQPADDVSVPDSRERLTARIDDLLENMAAQDQALRDAYDAANKIMQDAAGSQLGQAWRDHLSAIKLDPANSGYFTAVMEVLEQMLIREIPQSRGAALTAFNTHTGNIRSYFDNLQEFSKTVSSYAKRLSRELNTEHEFSAISDIEIALKAKIDSDESDIVTPLKVFLSAYKNEALPAGELPSAALIEDYQKAVDALAGITLDSKTVNLIDMEIRAKENGRPVIIRRDADLSNASSTGISMLIIVVLFSGLTRYLCPDENAAIHWPLDEIGRLDLDNLRKLFPFMQRHNLRLICAQPDINREIAAKFDRSYVLRRGQGVFEYRHEKPSAPNRLISS